MASVNRRPALTLDQLVQNKKWAHQHPSKSVTSQEEQAQPLGEANHNDEYATAEPTPRTLVNTYSARTTPSPTKRTAFADVDELIKAREMAGQLGDGYDMVVPKKDEDGSHLPSAQKEHHHHRVLDKDSAKGDTNGFAISPASTTKEVESPYTSGGLPNPSTEESKQSFDVKAPTFQPSSNSNIEKIMNLRNLTTYDNNAKSFLQNGQYSPQEGYVTTHLNANELMLINALRNTSRSGKINPRDTMNYLMNNLVKRVVENHDVVKRAERDRPDTGANAREVLRLIAATLEGHFASPAEEASNEDVLHSFWVLLNTYYL